ncbi:flagellar hook-associated protein FlgK [Alginatibacterium sediminis]|uniref:Flagellar hook-associated protein 1 n=1 Tax=Alginatibacterium sediminis TaxID=2164068 RepID=A0A420EFZ3_9ALTE|nr:flagellar hook-associated protein FlgK [Alginatibacterium sediminis]RKF19631.1 flagellar hook-associated protein FlgK [Alginatibacterium sediminis]
MASNSLLSIGTSGVIAHQRMLMTTGNNISNINTPGYSLQRTFFQSDVLGGVRDGNTQRVVNSFYQAQVWRDTSGFNNKNAYLESISNLDYIVSDDSLSLSNQFDSMYAGLHAMADDPRALSTRELSLSGFSTMQQRYANLNDQYRIQSDANNNDLKGKVQESNDLIREISDLNKQIKAYAENPVDGGVAILQDKRDEATRKLSELVEVNVIGNEDGTSLVFLKSGQSLVLEQDYATLSMEDGDPDKTKLDFHISVAGTSRKVPFENVGGAIAGLMEYRAEVIEVSRNQLGQLAIAMADAFNTQNALGMDLNGDIGGDIFELPSFDGKAFSTNPSTGQISGSFVAGEGSDVLPYDYRIQFTSANTIEVQRYQGETPIGTPELHDFTAPVPPSTATEFFIDGLEFDMSGGPFAATDKFLIQPTRDASAALQMAMTQPEKLALAAPVRAERDINNRGNASVTIDDVYSTQAGGSAFIPPGSYDINYPSSVEINAAGDYEIYDGNTPAVLLGTAPANSNGQNLFASAGITPDPGYDININGDVQEADTFSLGYNTDGYADNFNALKMVDLQQADTVRKSIASTGDNKMTMNEAYASLVSFVGGKTSTARADVAANDALLTQSLNRHYSVSGVNMDEEASNLIRFEQAYAASSQIIAAAKTTFDTLLSSIR